MNITTLQNLTQGRFGRKIAYTNVEEINESNIVKVLGKAISVFNYNKPAIKYLWDYKNGTQPIISRVKAIREDINNKIVENHAWEIVQFKNAQTYGEPIQYISRKQDDNASENVSKLNDYATVANKPVKDISSGEWTSAVGTGFKAIQRKGGKVPFRITVPTPMNTFIIYSSYTEEPMLAVQHLKDENDNMYYLCYDDTFEYKIQNSNLLSYGLTEDGQTIYKQLHLFGGIPIVEFPNNQDRISDIELVIDLLDAINNMASNRMDAIEQFVQSWVKFVNCDVDETSFNEMKRQGALMVKSTKDKQADVSIMTQELNQSQTQVAKDDLWDNVLTISAIPNKEGSTGGDTAGAVQLRNGWDFSKQRAKLKDPYIVEGEKRLAQLIINAVNLANGENTLPIDLIDMDVIISHSPTDNMYVKAEVYTMLVNNGIHPLIAISTCGLWGDAEKVFTNSKEYLDKMLDKLYASTDMSEAEINEQTKKAQELIGKNQDNRLK